MKRIDLTHLHKYVDWAPNNHSQYLLHPAGNEHYQLLAYLATQLRPGESVLDIGTFYGYSAAAFAYNPAIRVITYDIIDCILSQKKDLSIHDIPNIDVRIGDYKEKIEELYTCPIVFLDVDPHDGIQEKEIVREFIRNGFDGIMICDDIYLNDAMRNFWNSIPLKKIDITKYGHWTGTGVIIFEENVIDVVVT